jgi:hypothetical protein
MNAETKALKVIEAKLMEAINECASWHERADVSPDKAIPAIAYVANLITCCEYLRKVTGPAGHTAAESERQAAADIVRRTKLRPD